VRCLGDGWIAVVRRGDKTCREVEELARSLQQRFGVRRILIVIDSDRTTIEAR